jgi:hypothetical protein
VTPVKPVKFHKKERLFASYVKSVHTTNGVVMSAHPVQPERLVPYKEESPIVNHVKPVIFHNKERLFVTYVKPVHTAKGVVMSAHPVQQGRLVPQKE